MKVPLTLLDFIDRAGLHGDRAAVVDEPGPASLGEVSFTGLQRRSWGMAHELERMGVGLGERVAIVSPNSARFVISLFGVSAYGRVLVPINFRLNATEIAYIVRHSGSRVVLIDSEIAASLGDLDGIETIRLDGVADAALFAESDRRPTGWEPDEDATASINYTSGTTARPKGVQLTHRTLWLHAVSFGWHLGVSARDVYLQTQPLFHCNGWGLPYGLAAMGARQVMQRKVDGPEILRRIATEGVTLTACAPAVLDAILAAGVVARTRRGETSQRGRMRVMTGGASPPTSTIRRIEEELGWELITINRAGPESDDLTPDERAARLTRQGMELIGVSIRVDEHGEVLARSNHVLEAYWDDPEATALALDGGWLHTGDGGGFNDAHHLLITDRKKDVIISGGENISSIEVEDCLRDHPAVVEVAVIGVPHERWGETVKALVVLGDGGAPTEADLIAHARSRMAAFKCPTSVEIRKSLPRTATGKIQKFLLRAPYWETPAT
jgi:fatty-acyl-CoA synthase